MKGMMLWHKTKLPYDFLLLGRRQKKILQCMGREGEGEGEGEGERKKIKPTKREQRIAIFIFFGDNNYLYDTSPMDI